MSKNKLSLLVGINLLGNYLGEYVISERGLDVTPTILRR